MQHVVSSIKKLLLCASGIMFMSLSAHADKIQTPEMLKGVTVITAEMAKPMVEKGVQIVDTRVVHEYTDGHIKGAVNIPYKDNSAKSPDFDASKDSFDLSKLPADKNAPIVFYCNSGECWKSYKSSVVAIKAGYKNVYWLRGGMPEWKAKGYPVE